MPHSYAPHTQHLSPVPLSLPLPEPQMFHPQPLQQQQPQQQHAHRASHRHAGKAAGHATGLTRDPRDRAATGNPRDVAAALPHSHSLSSMQHLSTSPPDHSAFQQQQQQQQHSHAPTTPISPFAHRPPILSPSTAHSPHAVLSATNNSSRLNRNVRSPLPHPPSLHHSSISASSSAAAASSAGSGYGIPSSPVMHLSYSPSTQRRSLPIDFSNQASAVSSSSHQRASLQLSPHRNHSSNIATTAPSSATSSHSPLSSATSTQVSQLFDTYFRESDAHLDARGEPDSASSSQSEAVVGSVLATTVSTLRAEIDALKKQLEASERSKLDAMMRTMHWQQEVKMLNRALAQAQIARGQKNAVAARLSVASNALSTLSSAQISSPSSSSSDSTSSWPSSALLSIASRSFQSHLEQLITFIAPTRASEQRRIMLLSWLKALVRKALGAQCYPVHDYALKTYLHAPASASSPFSFASSTTSSSSFSSSLDISAFFSRAHDSSWLQRLVNALCSEAYNTTAMMESELITPSTIHMVQKVTVNFSSSSSSVVSSSSSSASPSPSGSSSSTVSSTTASSSYVTCFIGGIPVSIFGNDIGALASLALFERFDLALGRAHLFKRSVLLLTCWAIKHRIFSATENEGMLTPLFLRTLVLSTVNMFHSEHSESAANSPSASNAAASPVEQEITPLHVILRLLLFLKTHDWDRHALTVFGPVELLSDDHGDFLCQAMEGHCSKPLLSVDIVHTFQSQSKHALRSAPSLSAHSAANPPSLPRVDSSAFLVESPAPSVGRDAPPRSQSETCLSSLHSSVATPASHRQASSSRAPTLTAATSFSRCASASPSALPAHAEDSSFSAVPFTASPRALRPHPNAELVPAYLTHHHHENTQQQQRSHVTAAAASFSTDSMPIPPTISAPVSAIYQSGDIQLHAFGSPPRETAPVSEPIYRHNEEHDTSFFDDIEAEEEAEDEQDGEEAEEDEEDQEEEIDSIYASEDDSSLCQLPSAEPTPSLSASSSPAPTPSPPPRSFVDVLYSSRYPLCSLSLLDALEPGRNLGVSIAYTNAYAIRKVLREGYDRLRGAIDAAVEAEEQRSAVSLSIIDHPVLSDLFDAELLSAYAERQLRESRRRHNMSSSSASSSSSSSTSSSSSSSSSSTVASPTHNAAPSPSKLNPLSNSFVPGGSPSPSPPLPSSSPAPTTPIASDRSPSSLRSSSSTSSLLSLQTGPSSLTSPSGAMAPSSNSSFSSELSVEFDALDGGLAKIEANLTHARQFETPDISEESLVALLIEILHERGAVPVGRIGSLLHDKTNNHSLPATLKEHFGGLKRLLEKHPHVFSIGTDHLFNPHVSLCRGVVVNTNASIHEHRASTPQLPQAGAMTSVSSSPSFSAPTTSSFLASSLQNHNLFSSAANAGVAPLPPNAQVDSVSFGKKKLQRRRNRVRRLGHGSSGSQSMGNLSSADPGLEALGALTPILGLDAEMVGVGPGGLRSALARVSVVNAQLQLVYDVYVKPNEPVTDYRTNVSGVRASDLEAALDFQTVQREVAALVKGRILVGHGLIADLQALCLNHPRHLLRDTAHYKPFCPVRPVSLRKLMEERLGEIIQQQEHSPVEDARAAMKLYNTVAATWEALSNKAGAINQENLGTVAYQLM